MNKLVLLAIILLLGSCSVPRVVGPYKVVQGKNKKTSIITNEDIEAKSAIPAVTPAISAATPTTPAANPATAAATPVTPAATPVTATATPATAAEPLYKPNTAETASVREEAFKAVNKEDNDKIKTYCVVIGSFSIENNAIKFKKQLQPEYEPIIVANEKGMFRVILASYNKIEDARAKIDEVANQFQKAWVLRQKK
jgi:cell division protein FtsN